METAMRVSLGVGKYSTKPYCLEGLGIHVYCLEELCYALCENAYLLDNSIMKDDIAEWIGNQCGLRDLANELLRMIHKKGTFSLFVCMILEYAAFYTPDEIKKVEEILKKGSGLSNMEKRKSQIDLLTQKKKYKAAIRGYCLLLEQWKEWEMEGRQMPPVKVMADIWHNKGVALAGLMIYDQAAVCFKQAYDLEPDNGYLKAYLAAKRMELTDSEYIAFVTGMNGIYEISLALEKEVEQLKREFRDQLEYQTLEERKRMRNGENKQGYYADNDRLISLFEENYRYNVSE